jgi:alpha-amylase
MSAAEPWSTLRAKSMRTHDGDRWKGHRLSAWALLAIGASTCGYGTRATNPVDASSTDIAGSPNIDASRNDAPIADASSPDGPSIVIDGRPKPGAAFVHLFEWKWTDIAIECERYLGPAGFSAVQVSPPSEHAVLAGYPWWQRYQTVGYSLARSRSGSLDEFRTMVERCAGAGVAVYVDAVINHMTGQASGVGSHGTRYTKYDYPGLYALNDFRQPPCTIAGADYENAPDRLRDCELLGLADLNTSSNYVRDRIADYLSSLVEMGVGGFRIDAAKHVAPSDLDAIVGRVSARVGASAFPYYFLEVIDHGTGAVRASDYLEVGQGAVGVTEFKYSGIGSKFLNTQGGLLGDLRSLSAASWGLMPSDRAVVFLENHDTERATSIFYQNAPHHDLALVFLLAWPYGYPSILSSYAFDRSTQAGRDRGPPSDAAGNTRSVYLSGNDSPDCAADPASSAPGTWLCQHRRPFLPQMIAFRKSTASSPEVTNFWDDGSNQIAFGRGNKGFVVINRSSSPVHRLFQTSLPSGSYCDVFQGQPSPGGCPGALVRVESSGQADIIAGPFSAVVIHVGAPATRPLTPPPRPTSR